jgi:hypothetical protein
VIPFIVGLLVCQRNKKQNSDIKDDPRVIFFFLYQQKMVKTLSSFRPSVANNAWMFSVTSESKKDLEKALVNLKEVHSSKLINSRIIDDPDVIGNYTLGGTCKTKDDASLIILFIENSLHKHEIIDDSYDWPQAND